MKNIRIANYSIYSDGFFTSEEKNFIKLYKGVRVSVDTSLNDNRFMHFSIRTKNVKECIWKRGDEEMTCLMFDDNRNIISCIFNNEPHNKSLHNLKFETDVYEELKKNIPDFILECGGKFKSSYSNDSKILLLEF